MKSAYDISVKSDAERFSRTANKVHPFNRGYLYSRGGHRL